MSNKKNLCRFLKIRFSVKITKQSNLEGYVGELHIEQWSAFAAGLQGHVDVAQNEGQLGNLDDCDDRLKYAEPFGHALEAG